MDESKQQEHAEDIKEFQPDSNEHPHSSDTDSAQKRQQNVQHQAAPSENGEKSGADEEILNSKPHSFHFTGIMLFYFWLSRHYFG